MYSSLEPSGCSHDGKGVPAEVNSIEVTSKSVTAFAVASSFGVSYKSSVAIGFIGNRSITTSRGSTALRAIMAATAR